MKTNSKTKKIFFVLLLLTFADIAVAQYGRGVRTVRRTVIVASAASENAAENQKEADAQAQQKKEADEKAKKDAETKKASTGGQPIGVIVNSLPTGCDTVVVNNTQYYHCGKDYYRTAYQGNNLVYVTTEPPL